MNHDQREIETSVRLIEDMVGDLGDVVRHLAREPRDPDLCRQRLVMTREDLRHAISLLRAVDEVISGVIFDLDPSLRRLLELGRDDAARA